MVKLDADKIINFIVDNMFKIVIALLVLFVIIIPKCCSDNKPNKKIKNRTTTTQTQTDNSYNKITFNIIVKGNGTITVQGNEYVVNELKDFEVSFSSCTDVAISWKSDIEGVDMSIHIKGDGIDRFEREWKSTQGELSFETGNNSCFIRTIRPGFI